MPQGVYSSAQQQQSPQQSQQQAQPANRTDNSALIKSLLANKVTPAGVGQTGSMDPHPTHQSPHSRPLLAPSTPPQQPRGASGAGSYVQALSQGPLGPVGPMLSPTSIGCTSGMQVVSGGVAGGAGGQHGLHQPPAPPPPAQVTTVVCRQREEALVVVKGTTLLLLLLTRCSWPLWPPQALVPGAGLSLVLFLSCHSQEWWWRWWFGNNLCVGAACLCQTWLVGPHNSTVPLLRTSFPLSRTD